VASCASAPQRAVVGAGHVEVIAVLAALGAGCTGATSDATLVAEITLRVRSLAKVREHIEECVGSACIATGCYVGSR
jgi:hypothetical protein